MKGHLFEKKNKYSIRKLSVGVCSALIGLAFLGAGAVSADEETTSSEVSPESTVASEEAVNALISEGGVYTADAVLPSREATSHASETQPSSSLDSSASDTVLDKDVEKPVAEKVSDLPTNEEKQLRPKEVKFDTWDDLLKWEPGKRVDDDLNRASIPLASRYQGKQINEQANPDAKIQALSNMNSKAKDHASVGGEEFKAYAFDYWQYLDSMVFWEGLVPSADVIDAAHRNGVPIYGTLFYNWSSSIKDQEHFAETLKEDSEGSKTFPIARKLVELAKYYGFDGYFINQETTGNLVEPLGPKLRDFLLYTKEYAKSLNYPIKYSWYDAMTYEYGRYHENALGEYNYNFMQPENGENPVDTFFANFNWGKSEVDYSISTAKWINRNPYDVLAGLELQKGGSYKTNVDWNAILDEHGKLRLSLGLYAPDTITGLGKTGEGYHIHEDLFWTGFQGDPTKGKPADQSWYGMSNLVVDKTPITNADFNTSFNTGHGKYWFVDGKISKDGEWNYRSVSGYLPTWRWWVEHSEDSTPLKGRYDFDQAYNGGNSLAFEGDLKANSSQNIMLYSTKIPVTETTKLSVSHKGGVGAAAWIAVATKEDYSEYVWKELTPNADWSTQTFDLGDLAGKTIYAVKMFFDHDADVKDYKFNLGQLSITSNQEKPAAPSEVTVKGKRLQNAQEAEAVLNFKGVADADYYEVYEKDGDNWRLLTGSSATTVYLPKVSRSASAEGTTQELKVVAVGKNGQRSDAGTVAFDWGMTVSDTSLPKALAPNVVIGAKVIGSSFPDADGSEGIEGMLNGTITSLSDKWSSAQLSGTVDIRLTQPRTIVRWVMDHAGAGGESVDDGKMNTRDFDLYYKDEAGEWKLAKEVRGNKAHVSDITLDHPIKAQEWRLHVITADNGTPWQAIRIYNWKMYESLDTETVNIPMKDAAAQNLGNHFVQVGFKDVPANTTISLYADKEATSPIATMTADQAGNLIFKPLAFESTPSLLYYRSQEPGKDISNVLAIEVPKNDKEISGVQLEEGLAKKVYREGDALSLKGATLRVHYQDGQADQLVNLTNSGVEILGFDSSKLGEQHLEVSYLGQKLDKTLTVFVVSAEEAGEKAVAGLELTEKPKVEYIVGEAFEKEGGRFTVVFEDETTETHALSDEGVEVTGFDASKEGRQTITIHYKGASTSFDVLVNPKPALNDEYLKQKLAEAEAAKAKVDFTFATPEVKEALLAGIAASEKVLKEHDNSTQDQVNEQLNQLTALLKALDGQANLVKEKETLSALTEEATALLASKPNHPSGDALQALVEKNKELLDSSELTPEALATAKTGLETLIALLKEDKPAVFVDPATGVEVQFSNLEPTAIKGLKVAKVEANQTEKEAFNGRDGKVYDIEGVDASGQDVDTHHPSLVKIPVDKDKEVEQVLFFPESQAPQSLAFERVGDVVIFTAPHFTHYAIVYKTPTPEVPVQPAEPEEPAKPDQPIQPDQPATPDQPVQPDQPATPDQPIQPENPTKPDQPANNQTSPEQLNPTKPTDPLNQKENGPDLLDQRVQQVLSHYLTPTKEGSSQPDQTSKETDKELPTTASLEATFAAEAVLLAALGGFLLAGKKKEE